MKSLSLFYTVFLMLFVAAPLCATTRVSEQLQNLNDRLMQVSYEGNLCEAKNLLAQGAQVNATTPEGVTPLFMAAQQGHEKNVHLLIGEGAEVNAARKNDGVTPLFMAAQQGHEENVRLLIGAGAQVNTANNDGITPLYFAVLHGHVGVVRLLLNAGAPVTRSEEPTSFMGGIVRFFSGAPVNVVGNDGVALLFTAVENGYEGVVRLLIDAGVPVNVANDDGVTPLHIAVAKDYTEIVRLFIDARVDVNATTLEGFTPLFDAAGGITDLLLDAGANVDKVAVGGTTPLIKAIQGGRIGTAQQLVAAGANINAVTGDNQTVFTIAQAQAEKYKEIKNLFIAFKFFESPVETIEELKKLPSLQEKREMVKVLLGASISQGKKDFIAMLLKVSSEVESILRQHAYIVAKRVGNHDIRYKMLTLRELAKKRVEALVN
jgi:ankyrin repeat protein